MSSARNPGRVVGYWYLLLVLLGPLRLIYIPNKLFVQGNAAATASNIAAHEWLFRFGALAYQSRFLPRFLGLWLIINGVAYVVLSFTGLFFPDYQDKVFIFSQPALFGELAIMLWLVIKGANPPLLEQSTGPVY